MFGLIVITIIFIFPRTHCISLFIQISRIIFLISININIISATTTTSATTTGNSRKVFIFV